MSAEEQQRSQAFIARWHGVQASELATSQSFVIELCELLGVPRPHPTPEQDYQFERPISFQHGDGSSSPGRIDCYRRGAFIWESKKLKLDAQTRAAQHSGGPSSQRFDEALLRARAQAEAYARALPASEGRPPFLVVVDVGHVIELYAEFSRSGATYTPYPDPRSHRIRLADLARPELRERLRQLWLDPLALDPARVSGRVTRAVAAELAELARSLEADGHPAQTVAAFLTRCLFSLFAEDVGLLPPGPDGRGSFEQLLRQHRDKPDTLARMLTVFWDGCDKGGFNAAIAADVLRFNGKLFKGAAGSGYALPLQPAQVDGLLRAARADWRHVEPAIFGTLLERALDPNERHALGAHYTPRAYVERLVLPTVVEPLRDDFANARAAALLLVKEAEALSAPKDARKREAKLQEARDELHRFHHQLCTTRVLDPACGSGNFLYITLEHLKRLEGEVLDLLAQLGETQDKLVLEGETVTLQQLLGIELNPRAAALAELVLWIGWLQWQLRTRGPSSVAEPVVHDYGNIECRDAVLAYDGMEPAQDAEGKPLLRWDGKTTKTHPVTGEAVPDESAQIQVWRYLNPRPAAWPQADFIVGNPPFIGTKRMRSLLGDGYVDALRASWPHVSDSSDFVMYWWDHAAELTRHGRVKRFGLITTNSIRQAFNRQVLSRHLQAKPELSICFAVPDHPWVDSANGAAVRISMTAGSAGVGLGTLSQVESESDGTDGEVTVALSQRSGTIGPDLRVGAAVATATALRANAGLSGMGVALHGSGFIIEPSQAAALRVAGASVIAPYLGGRDLLQRPRERYLIDFSGLTEAEARATNPAAYQRVMDYVKPERDHNSRRTIRELWWRFGWERPLVRKAIKPLSRYVGTTETAKHRAFQFIDANVLSDHMVVCIASSDATHLGVLSSQIHIDWALAAGGTLEDRPRYNKSVCFERFPFPSDDTGLTPELTERIRHLAEQLDAHRKARQAAHEAVTLTGLYNVLDKLRRGEALSAKDKLLHEQGLVGVLLSLHEELDAAVLAAYGWSDLGPVPWRDEEARRGWTETLLQRLVELNARRAVEEAQGLVRWLRPEFQDPARRQATLPAVEAPAAAPAEAEAAEAEEATQAAAPAAAASATARQPWPEGLPAQMRAVAELLGTRPGATAWTEALLGERFSGRGPWKKRLPQILDTLEALGRARRVEGGWQGC
ncbi:class I SAM-dependent DNA methyltransferase [Inhella sp.]|uniref:class I SAM-dependent DNA methyltransferase n=1 Tax=Inhella sp. TaxID=1921806 RepID=UPI0035AE107C